MQKVWDYSGCVYPEGFLSSKQTCLFNHDQIEKIYYLGLEDDKEEIDFKKKLKKLTKKKVDFKDIFEQKNKIKDLDQEMIKSIGNNNSEC